MTRKNMGIVSIPSKIPRWFDPEVEGFDETKPKDWKGARVRIKVKCDASQDYGRLLDKARRSAEHKYRGAEIYVVPKFRDNVKTDKVFRSTDSDERKIEQYIKQCGSRLERPERVLKYMVGLLEQVSQAKRQHLSINFESIRAENFLPYKKLYLNLRQKGLWLIQAVNHDRNKKSNGGGKTSLVQPIPVALFGKTFKDQKHDSWANRFVPKEPATVSVKFLNANNQEVVVTRGRRPPLLKMEVNGKDVSSGMKSNDRDGTQQQIETYTGFTAQTLSNAVYIDRTISDAFLSGTKRSRTELLSRFQNLERFTRALDLVKRDIKGNQFNQTKVREDLAGNKSAIRHKREEIVSIEKVTHGQLTKAKREYKRARVSEHNYIASSRSRRKDLQHEVHIHEAVLGRLRKLRSSVGEHIYSTRQSISKEKISFSKTCPTCHQKVSKEWLKVYSSKIEKDEKKAEAKLVKLNNKLKLLDWRISTYESNNESAETKLSKIRSKTESLHSTTVAFHKQYVHLLKANETDAQTSKARKDYREFKRKRIELKKTLHNYHSEHKVLEFAEEAFSRDGIPAFLNRTLCPVLTKSSDYYAELFSDKEIQLQFVFEEGEVVPKVINAKGGEDIDAQSAGERALAGLITSFALRECAPKSNLLVLDEPGEGLDAPTAKQFARSLQELKKRFGLIIVCTHNVNIASELNPDKTITVVKKNGISKIKES